jgi:glyoxylase-like metal-dependent hydrolase (beta-lactamase superfamily II)
MEIKQLALGMVNAYLIKNNTECFLIDTGMPMNKLKLENALKLEGIKTEEIKLVIITHSDIDHIGNCAYLQREKGLKIAVHDLDANQCRTGRINLNRKRKASLFSKMVKSVLFFLVLKRLMKKFPLESFEPDIILSDGQDLNPYGLDANVVHIPGHTMGSIGILTGEGDFLSGDTINNRKKPTVADIVENETALQSSLKIIKNLSIRNVYPGHGTPFHMSELKL